MMQPSVLPTFLVRPVSRKYLAAAIVVLLTCAPASAFAASPQVQQPTPATGRVLAVITQADGSVPISGVAVELRALDGNVVIAKTITDAAGEAIIPDVAAGNYVIAATPPGFAATESAPFEVRAGETTRVPLQIQLVYIAPGVEVSAPTTSPTSRANPVATSDMLLGSVLEIAPLEGDDFQSLLPLLPGVVRGPDGRLRAKGGQPTQGALQISSASLVDPSSGDFDLELPGSSIESVELLANPFSAEYGRFSSSITTIRTKRGTNDWQFSPGGLVPRFRKGFRGVRKFEPRFSVRGPIKKDRVFFSQDFQARYVNDPVKSLPGEPGVELRSFDSFTRIDGIISSRHALGGLLVIFPRAIENLTLNTFRPPEATPEFHQGGVSMGVQDRFALNPSLVLESTVATRYFEVEVHGDSRQAMVYTPETQRGNFFNDQERAVNSFQWVETLSLAVNNWHGQHLFRFGMDYQHSSYDGTSESFPIEVRRLDGSLAELTVPGAPTDQDMEGNELALFAQDRWRIGSRVTLEAGLRMDREDIVGHTTWSPRAGASVSVLPEGRAILRGGIGRFQTRTPLNVGAFEQFEDRTVTRFGTDGAPLGPPVRFVNVTDPDLHTPHAVTGNLEWNQRFGRRYLVKANYLKRNGAKEYILEPDPERGELRLESTGKSKYWEFELTGRYLGGERRDLTVSYVWSRGTADLNNYDQFYGNVRNPIIRPNENSLISTDVPNRLIVRGNWGLPGKWDFAPVFEIRTGFPWSAVDEFQDFVSPRNEAGRLPKVRTLDFSLARPWHFRQYRFRAGIKIYNVFGDLAQRDVQSNLTSPHYGEFYNPLERSIGFTFGVDR